MMDEAGFDFCPELPRVRIWPVRGRPGLSPALLWDDLVPGLASTDGGVLACPWCGLGSVLRLAWIHVAMPGAATNAPHADADVGVVLAIEVWCANGCRGRLEFRQHVDAEDGADVVVLNLVETSPAPDGIGPDGEPEHNGLVLAGDADPNEPPF